MAGRNLYYSGPTSDHFDGERFFNPGHPGIYRSWRDILRWRLRGKRAHWPSFVTGRRVAPEARVEMLRVTMIGHATLLIQAPGLNVLTDPVWSDRASPFRFAGPRRVTPPSVPFEDLPPIDVVLLSHNHFDHLDLATLLRLHRAHSPLFVSPLGNDSIVRGAIPDARIVAGDWGDRIGLENNADVHIVPAYHWSARGTRDHVMALWGGFMLRTAAGLVYFAGDTAYGDGAIFRSMRKRYGRADVALLPIGTYEPRWFLGDHHVEPAEAVQIMVDLDARRSIGIHWGVFPLADEEWEEPPLLLNRALAAQGIDPARFVAAKPGDVFDIAGPGGTEARSSGTVLSNAELG